MTENTAEKIEETPVVEKTIQELLHDSEEKYAAFKDTVMRIVNMGYRYDMQPNGKAYVYRDVRESYGELFKAPEQSKPQQPIVPVK